jgi:hypothetical protein
MRRSHRKFFGQIKIWSRTSGGGIPAEGGGGGTMDQRGAVIWVCVMMMRWAYGGCLLGICSSSRRVIILYPRQLGEISSLALASSAPDACVSAAASPVTAKLHSVFRRQQSANRSAWALAYYIESAFCTILDAIFHRLDLQQPRGFKAVCFQVSSIRFDFSVLQLVVK